MRRWLDHPLLPPVVLIALTFVVLVRYDRPLIRGDGVAYLAWVDTFVRDGDLDLTNQYERFQAVNTYQITWDTEREHFVNIFPFGAAIVHAPLYALGEGVVERGWLNANPDYFRQMQGVEQAYSVLIMIGANALALGAALLAWWLACHLTGPWTAALLAWALLVGTPLLYYSTVTPLNSHNPAAFLLAAVLALLIGRAGTRAPEAAPESGAAEDSAARTPIAVTLGVAAWIALGALAGLMVLVRWQLIAVAAIGWIALLARRQWGGLAIATASAAIVLIPLPVVWDHLFGEPFVVPYDETTGQQFLGLPVNAHRVLWRTVSYSPMIALSLLGLPALWRRDRPSELGQHSRPSELGQHSRLSDLRRHSRVSDLSRHSRLWTLLFAGMILSQALINGSTRDWYAGDSFGSRRMSELYPVYVVLAAALVGRLPRPEALRGWRAVRLVGARLAVLALLVYSLIFFRAFLLFTWTNPQGLFADQPATMLRYYRDHPAREATLHAVLDAHVGPRAWSQPGP